jgi:hypothetical protein
MTASSAMATAAGVEVIVGVKVGHGVRVATGLGIEEEAVSKKPQASILKARMTTATRDSN